MSSAACGRELEEFDPHAFGRAAASDVEDVGRQAGQIILPRPRAVSGASLSRPPGGGHCAGCVCKSDMAAAPLSAIANSPSP